MAYIRRLPSGLYQATVRRPDGKRRTKTDRLKKTVEKWAKAEEARYAAGDHRDPRDGEISIGTWRARVSAGRGLEPGTIAKLDSVWRTHCEAEWETWPMNAITRTEAQNWVKRLQRTRRARHKGRTVTKAGKDVPLLGAEMIHTIVNTMSKLYALAMAEHPPLVAANPFAGLDLPTIQPRPIEFYEHAEAELLYAELEKLGVKWRALVELGMHVGLRPGEIYGLHASRVDWARRLAHITQVMTRYGLREYPKSKRSHRAAPIPGHLIEGMSALMTGRDAFAKCTCPKILADGTRLAGAGPCPGLIFTAPEGGPIDDGNFRDRIWRPAVTAAGIRYFPPKVMRHTAASWLVQDGVSLYKVQALLGHESYATTQRYAHLAPDAHEDVIAAWSRSKEETVDSDARVTHGVKKAPPRQSRERGHDLAVGDTGIEPVTSTVSRKTGPQAGDR